MRGPNGPNSPNAPRGHTSVTRPEFSSFTLPTYGAYKTGDYHDSHIVDDHSDYGHGKSHGHGYAAGNGGLQHQLRSSDDFNGKESFDSHSFGSHDSGYGAPARRPSGYGAPARGYGAPSRGYGAPASRNYGGKRDIGYGSSGRYGAPARTSHGGYSSYGEYKRPEPSHSHRVNKGYGSP